MKAYHYIFFIIIAFSFFNKTIYASGDTFQITAPPIPYPSYESGKSDSKMTLLYGTISGAGLDLKGGGFNGAFRSVPLESSNVAFGGNAGMAVASGNYVHPENLIFTSNGFSGVLAKPKLDLVMMGFDFSATFEYQFFKTKYASLIGFGGFDLPFAFGSLSGKSNVSISGTYFGHNFSGKQEITYTGSIISLLYGVPFGLQGGIYPHRYWTITPFIFFNEFLGGTTGISATAKTSFYYYGNQTLSKSYSNTYSIGSFMTKSYGTDIVFEPLKLSLGAALQDGNSGGSVGPVKVKIYQLSYNSTF